MPGLPHLPARPGVLWYCPGRGEALPCHRKKKSRRSSSTTTRRRREALLGKGSSRRRTVVVSGRREGDHGGGVGDGVCVWVIMVIRRILVMRVIMSIWECALLGL